MTRHNNINHLTHAVTTKIVLAALWRCGIPHCMDKEEREILAEGEVYRLVLYSDGQVYIEELKKESTDDWELVKFKDYRNETTLILLMEISRWLKQEQLKFSNPIKLR